jgi:hypothetical protein
LACDAIRAKGPLKKGLPSELYKAGVAAVVAATCCTCHDEEFLLQVLGSQALFASPGYIYANASVFCCIAGSIDAAAISAFPCVTACTSNLF